MKPKYNTPFQLCGNILVPGDYVMQIENSSLVAVVEMELSKTIGKLCVARVLMGDDFSVEPHDAKALGLAIYDDGTTRFENDARLWINPNELLHIAIEYGLKQQDDDCDKPREIKGIKETLVFSKTLDEYLRMPYDTNRQIFVETLGRDNEMNQPKYILQKRSSSD